MDELSSSGSNILENPPLFILLIVFKLLFSLSKDIFNKYDFNSEISVVILNKFF